MKATKFIIAGIALVAVFTFMCQPKPLEAEFTDLEPARAAATKENKPIVAIFGAVWCAPCKDLERDVLSDSGIQESLKPFISVHLDVDTDPGKRAQSEFGISTVPTVLFLSPKGRELLRVVGYVPGGKFREAIKAAKNGL